MDWDRVYNFRDFPDFDATQQHCFLDSQEHPTSQLLPFRPAPGVGRSTRRYAARSLMHGGTELGRLQQIIRQLVIHHDGLFGARQCFHVLHDERGLSAHFIIDNDGTIYQTLDLVHCAYHASGVNVCSIGVEVCNRGKVISGEEYHYRGALERGQTRVRVHGTEYLMWQFTEPQYQAIIALGQALLRLFPRLPQVFPEDSSGVAIPGALSEPREFSGYLGHYHVTRNKWDPGCFDFERVVKSVRGTPTWFLMPGAAQTPIASDPAAARVQAQALLENNHDDAMGGYFPVGPCRDTYVWHGGIHLDLPEGTPIFCPFPGRVAAARSGLTTAIGSSDFVLVEHELSLRGKSVRFFLLFFHVEFHGEPAAAPPWLARVRRRSPLPLRSGEVFFPEVAVGSGDLLGQIGLAGPPRALEGQVHVEIIATSELGAELQPDFFRALSPRDPGPFCSEREILGPLDPRLHGYPQRPAGSVLREFFQRAPDRDALQRVAVRFQSEWVRSAARDARLLHSPDFRALPAPMAVLREQIRPTQWWTPEVARRVGLPEDGVVWHYHPVMFLLWVQELLQQDLATRTRADAAQPDAARPPAPVTDGYTGDIGYVDDEDRMSQEDNLIGLEQIVEGWPD